MKRARSAEIVFDKRCFGPRAPIGKPIIVLATAILDWAGFVTATHSSTESSISFTG
jgi:hypothetical protein